MDSDSYFRQAEGFTKKRINGGGEELSPYENLMSYYERLQSGYHWTVAEIDNTEIDVLLIQMAILAKRDSKQNTKFIDDVMG